jgi:hypothetical protein
MGSPACIAAGTDCCLASSAGKTHATKERTEMMLAKRISMAFPPGLNFRYRLDPAPRKGMPHRNEHPFSESYTPLAAKVDDRLSDFLNSANVELVLIARRQSLSVGRMCVRIDPV